MDNDKFSDVLINGLIKVNLFDGMSRELVTEVYRRVGGEVLTCASGEVVVYEGTRARWVVAVLSGRLGVYESGASGRRHLVRVVETGHLFGATMVTANLEYYPGMAVAGEASEVVFLEIEKIKKIWRDAKFAKLFENLYTIVSAEVLNCWRKMSILACKKAEDRVMLYLRWRAAEVGDLDMTLPFSTSEQFAQFLGLTRTAQSLAVKRLVARGEIAHPGGRNRFVLVVPGGGGIIA